jgi:hypothetical protein
MPTWKVLGTDHGAQFGQILVIYVALDKDHVITWSFPDHVLLAFVSVA